MEQHANEWMDERSECVRKIYECGGSQRNTKSALVHFNGLLIAGSHRVDPLRRMFGVRIAPKKSFIYDILWVMTCNVAFTGGVDDDEVNFVCHQKVICSEKKLADPEYVQIVREGYFIWLNAQKRKWKAERIRPFHTNDRGRQICIERCRYARNMRIFAKRKWFYVMLTIEKWNIPLASLIARSWTHFRINANLIHPSHSFAGLLPSAKVIWLITIIFIEHRPVVVRTHCQIHGFSETRFRTHAISTYANRFLHFMPKCSPSADCSNLNSIEFPTNHFETHKFYFIYSWSWLTLNRVSYER